MTKRRRMIEAEPLASLPGSLLVVRSFQVFRFLREPGNVPPTLDVLEEFQAVEEAARAATA